MSTLSELVRDKVLHDALVTAKFPRTVAGASAEADYVDMQLNALTNVELLDRISAALPESDRRAYHISEMPKSTVEAIKTSRMDSRHDHLNALEMSTLSVKLGI